jgi:hypothetical protein
MLNTIKYYKEKKLENEMFKKEYKKVIRCY